MLDDELDEVAEKIDEVVCDVIENDEIEVNIERDDDELVVVMLELDVNEYLYYVISHLVDMI